MSNSLEGHAEQQQPPQPTTSGRMKNLVQFRVRPEQLALFRRLADFLYQNGFIQEPSLSRMGQMCCLMIGQKFERQEAQNLERYMSKRLGDARAKVNPKFRDEQYFYSHGQSQPQPQPQPQIQMPQRPAASVLKKPNVIPQINDEWLWQQENQQQEGGGY